MSTGLDELGKDNEIESKILSALHSYFSTSQDVYHQLLTQQTQQTNEYLDGLSNDLLYFWVSRGLRFWSVQGDDYLSDFENSQISTEPHTNYLSSVLYKWFTTGKLEHFSEMGQPFLIDYVDEIAILEGKRSILEEWVRIVGNETDEKVKTATSSFIQSIGMFGVQSLLGIRHTIGTRCDVPPPGISIMLTTFCELQSSSSLLTTGARALSKHCERSLDGWWGQGNMGTIQEKNDKALKVLKRIVSNPAWQNIHGLPGTVVYELRCKEGYGARWEAKKPNKVDEKNAIWIWLFRGFLEPSMVDGHEKGWVH